ncbi:MAG TPA: flippase [Pyrinomonadaceae bacterium]|nr:flippase [Pyrinomonadaceae bacterium]
MEYLFHFAQQQLARERSFIRRVLGGVVQDLAAKSSAISRAARSFFQLSAPVSPDAARSVLESIAVTPENADSPENTPPSTAGMTTKVVKGSLWTLLGQVAPLAVSLVATPFTIRLLGAEGYGVLILVGLIPTYLGFADFGMGLASTKFASEAYAAGDAEREARTVRTAAVIALCASVPVALLVILFSGRLVTLFNVPEHLFAEASLALKVAAVTFVLNFLNSIFNTPQLTRLRMDLNTFVTSGFRMLGIIATPIVIYLGFGILGAIVVLLAASLLTLAGHIYTSGRLLPKLFDLSLDRNAIRPLLKFGGAFAISTVAALLLGSSEKFILAHSTTMKELAYYSVAFTIATMLTMFSGAMTQSLVPAFSQLQGEGQHERLSDLYNRCIRLTSIAFFPTIVFVAIIGRPFLSIWAGEDFSQRSIGPLYILLAGLLLNAVAFFPAAMLMASGRTRTLAKLYWFELVAYIPLAFLLVSSYGALGAAAAWSIRVILDTFLLFLLARSASSVSVDRPAAMAAIAVAILAIPAGLVLYFGSLTGVLIAISLTAFVAYAVMVWHFVLTTDELDWLRSRKYGRANFQY